MLAGKLRHRVTVQQLVAGSPNQNAVGEPDTTWTDYLSAWASIDPVTGSEPFMAQQQFPKVSHKIRMRYRDSVTADMRVAYGSRYFDIKAVLNWGERDRELLLLCEEGVNNG